MFTNKMINHSQQQAVLNILTTYMKKNRNSKTTTNNYYKNANLVTTNMNIYFFHKLLLKIELKNILNVFNIFFMLIFAKF